MQDLALDLHLLKVSVEVPNAERRAGDIGRLEDFSVLTRYRREPSAGWTCIGGR